MAEEKLEVLAVLYLLAFFTGSTWEIIFPTHPFPGSLAAHREYLPGDGGIHYFAVLPVLGGLFYGLLGLPVSLGLGYEHREVFAALGEMMRADLFSGPATVSEPSISAFTCYAAWMILAVSGCTLGASFSYLHGGSRGEMLVSGLAYLAAASFLTMEGGCP